MVSLSRKMMVNMQLVALFCLCSVNAFVVPRSGFIVQKGAPTSSSLFMASAEEEAQRLRDQAAKLRAEAAELSGKPEAEQAAAAVEETSTAVEPTSGTFYDDEVQPTRKDPLSDSMRQRLMREASTGLDSEAKQTNVILYISIAVVVLVLLGGQGILY